MPGLQGSYVGCLRYDYRMYIQPTNFCAGEILPSTDHQWCQGNDAATFRNEFLLDETFQLFTEFRSLYFFQI